MESAVQILKNLVENNEFTEWMIVNVLSGFVFSYINVLMFTNLFKVETTKKRKILLILSNAILKIVSSMIIVAPYYRAVNMVISIFLTKYILNIKIEKSIVGYVINSISIISVEVIFSKLLCLLFSDVNTYQNGMYNARYKFCLIFLISVCRLLMCFFIKKKNITINLGYEISKENRNSIIVISLLGGVVVFFNSIEMTMFISDFPYSIFIIDIICILICFYVSMKSIVKINKLEEQDIKIHNLESYNKTLSIMYDSIRGFRHDYCNFVQALDGYVRINNIEGIKQMSKSVLKECIDVNNMGILDPEIINNPAIYSIITNKYYLAQENDITMNIEVMIDLNDLKIGMYEFSRILAILLDNAIEASKECNEKIINVKFVKDLKVNRKLIIIENSYSRKDIDLDKIFEKGYTTKEYSEDKHGLGLWTVRRILNKNTNLSLFTTKAELFSQQLEIYE